MTLLAESHPNEVAEALTSRDYISFSAISAYRMCPLRYFLKYVEGLPEETVSASLVLGGAIHSAVENHFTAVMIGNPAPDHDTVRTRNGDLFLERIRSHRGSSIEQLRGRLVVRRNARLRELCDAVRPQGESCRNGYEK